MFLQSIKDKISEYLGGLSFLSDYILLILIIALSIIAYLIVCKYVIKLINKSIYKSKIKFDDHIIESKTFKWLSYIIPLLILKNIVFLFPSAGKILNVIINIFIILLVAASMTSFLRGLNSYYETKPISKTRPIKGYIQVVNIIIFILGIIIIIAMLTGESPLAILGGLGAMTAVLILVFRDTILSFVSSIQISGYDLVRKGDWIEMPKYGADGDVIDIALHTVKVQNWDKTITTIPTSKLVEDGFRNWRGMQQSGGRRIKRSLNIDVTSIKFCTPVMVEKLSGIQLLKDYISKKKEDLIKYNKDSNADGSNPVNGRRMTNVGTFRAYVAAYLKAHPKINHNLTCMVRQLSPGSQGLPFEIYAFTNTVVWAEYEGIQADIFDHIYAIVPFFELRVFQDPSGEDIRNIDIGRLNK